MVPFGYFLGPAGDAADFWQVREAAAWLRVLRLQVDTRGLGLGLSYKGINGVATSFYGGGNSHIFLKFHPENTQFDS